MKIPSVIPDRFQTEQGLFSSPASEPEALAFTPASRNDALLSLRETADVERDLQEWSAYAAQWEEQFTASRKGTDARNAEQAAREMHEKFYESRRIAYAKNPRCARYLREEGSAIASRSMQNMAAYTQAEDTRYIEGVLQNEEQKLRHTMASPDASDHDRMQAFNSFAMKMSSWRTTRGESPEAIKQWRTAFAMDMGTEYLQARFQRSLDENPNTALATIQAAQSLRSHPAQITDPAASKPIAKAKNMGIAATLLTSSEAAPKTHATADAEGATASGIPHSGSDSNASGRKRANSIDDASSSEESVAASNAVRALLIPSKSDAGNTENTADAKANPRNPNTDATQGDTPAQIAPRLSSGIASGVSAEMSSSTAQVAAQDEIQGAASTNATGSALTADLSPEDAQKHTLIQSHAAEYARFFSPEQLDILHSQAQAQARQRQLDMTEQRQNIQRDTKGALSKALKENDFTALLQAEAALVALGDPKAAQAAASLHKAAKLAQPQLALIEHQPLSLRRALAQTVFTHHTLKNIDDGIAANTLQHWHEEKLRADEAFFQRDPAGFVANHPRLTQQGISHEEFLQQQGISEQEYIERSLAQQLSIGTNQNVTPKVLSTQQAADLKDQFADCKNTRKKAEFLLNKAKELGSYSCFALAEAGFSGALAAFAEVLPQLATSDVEKFVQASEQHVATLNLPTAQKNEIQQQVAASPLLAAILGAEAAWQTEVQDTISQEVANTLACYIAQGGNLKDLERKTQHLNDALQAENTAAQDGDAKSWSEELLRGLGIGTHGILDAFLGTGDSIATPARWGLNKANAFLGGSDTYFTPMADAVPNALGLPTPETDIEKFAYNTNNMLASLPLAVWGGNALLAGKSVHSGQTLTQSVGKLLAHNPTEQAASSIGAAAALTAAQTMGASPAAQIGASLLGGSASSKAIATKTAASMQNNAGQIGAQKTAQAAHLGNGADAVKPEKIKIESFPLTKYLHIAPNKWNYFFGRATGTQHNLDRTKQMQGIMEKLGIEDSPQGYRLLSTHFKETAYAPTPGVKVTSGTKSTAIKESFYTGPSGLTVKFETVFMIKDDGSWKFITAMPKILKRDYKKQKPS